MAEKSGGSLPSSSGAVGNLLELEGGIDRRREFAVSDDHYATLLASACQTDGAVGMA